MTFSYTQIAQYLRCPRSYRYRYLDGWREKDNRASLLFGRASRRPWRPSSQARTALRRCSRSGEPTRKRRWSIPRETTGSACFAKGCSCSNGWPKTTASGSASLNATCRSSWFGPLSAGNDFVAYLDAVGTLDGKPSLLEWKTTTARYPEEPEGLLALDPQLICYSWISGISDVAVVAFVRKRVSEIQYLKTTISDQQRREFGQLVGATVSQIEAGQFAPHSGIRFPQNGCVSCAQLGLCLGNQQLVDAKLIRRPGASDLDWLDHLDD